jgi:hypothetical protein
MNNAPKPRFVRRLIAALIALAGILPGAAFAREHRVACTQATATATTIEVIQADYKPWMGRCVRLNGIMFQSHLFADRMALIEPASLFGAKRKHALFIYGRNWASPRPRPSMIELIGTVGSCAAQNNLIAAIQADNPGDILMLSGFCHTSLETFVAPVAITITSDKPILRLSEAEVPAGDRPLIEVPAGVTISERHVAAAAQLATALATDDEPAARRLMNPEVEQYLAEEDRTNPPGWLREDLREAHAAYVKAKPLRRTFAAMTPVDARQRHILIDRDDLPDPSHSGALTRLIVCWCTGTDCTGRWPISETDIDTAPDRPYRCVTTDNYLVRPGHSEIEATIATTPPGFAEAGR